MKKYKIVVFVPESHGDKLREAMGNAGAVQIGDYTFCTFTSMWRAQLYPALAGRRAGVASDLGGGQSRLVATRKNWFDL